MPISPALVAMIRIVKARMATQIPATWAKSIGWKAVTIPATGSSFQVVANPVVYACDWGSRTTGKTLMPMVGRKAETKSTATITP